MLDILYFAALAPGDLYLSVGSKYGTGVNPDIVAIAVCILIDC